jgi:hypothetical protein
MTLSPTKININPFPITLPSLALLKKTLFDSVPVHLRSLLADLHPEVVARYYGCGTPLPPALHGATVLDMGCIG